VHIDLDVVKPTAGGRMLARHEGQVVLVWGAIPGERVRARVERSGKGVLYAETIEVLSASPDRRDPGGDWRCGGNVLSHVAYGRQRALKGEIIQDAFGRIGRVPLASPPGVIGSPERGYRMRARLHARDRRLGFYREGTHDLCSPAPTGQFLPETIEWIAAAEAALEQSKLDGVLALEIAEDIPGDQRASHVEVREGEDPSHYDALRTDQSGVTDVLHVKEGDASSALRLRRDARAFFQGNRFLLERFVREVVRRVPPGPVVDLYAGVGLFGLSLAAIGFDAVTLVEGDPISGSDLMGNAEPFIQRVRVHRASVEEFLASASADPATYIVDPPRTGMSKDAIAGIIQKTPARIVYVSCDVATLARDARTLLDAGYELGELTGIDLFPNTAQVETIAVFARDISPVQ
jgi:23S rRNA (uracil1939-C5)-methyltransferase